MKTNFKKEDMVQVISGKAKGRSGKVLRVLKSKGALVVEGINKAKKHEKPNQNNEKGGIVDKEMPINISNVMLISPKTNKPIKVTRKKMENGKNVRVDKKTGKPIDA